MRKINILIASIIVMIMLTGSVVAQEPIKPPKEVPFSLSSWIRHTFPMETFSVVGSTRSCDLEPTKKWTIGWGETLLIKTEDRCPSGSGLIDVFLDDYAHPWREFSNIAYVTCDETHDSCIFQLYCCDHEECFYDSDCNWAGEGSECETISCTPWDSGYRCTAEGVTENEIPYESSMFSYCTQGGITCYYYPGSGDSCLDRFYAGETSCPLSYAGKTLYNSKSVCEGDIPTNGEVGDIRMSKDWKIEKHSYLDDKAKITITLKNYGTKTETINLEAGFYSSSYASDIAQLYATFPLFSAIPTPNCNPAEEFVKTRKVTLAPNEEEEVEIEVIPYFAFQTYKKGTTNLKTDPLIVFVGLYKECLGGYVNEAGTTGKGVMFDYTTYPTSCTFRILGIGGADVWCGSEKIGYCSGSKLVLDEKCNIPLTIDVINGTVPPEVTVDKTSLIGAKKISLTKDRISKATSQDLLAHSCLSSKECIVAVEDEEDYEAECVTIARLREDDVLTQLDSKNFFSNAKKIVKGTTYGVAAGVVGCVVLSHVSTALAVGPGVLLASPALLGGCAAVGGLIGGVGTNIILDLTQDDALLDALHAENENAVGICVKESKGIGLEWAEWAAWFDITRDGQKDGVDGLIIILIGGAIAILFLRR